MCCCCGSSKNQIFPVTDPDSAVIPFKKPIKLDVPLVALDPTFVKRKKEVGSKTFTCKSGRTFRYFTDGAADPKEEKVSVVLMLHGAGQNGSGGYILPEHPKDIFTIVPDRMGHGGSSPQPVTGYFFDAAVAEMMELVDAVYAEKKIPKDKKFFVLGHSCGACLTIEMGACPDLKNRIAGIAPISAPMDQFGKQATKEELKKCGTPGFLKNLNKKGCGGGFNRWLWIKLSFAAIGNTLQKDWNWRWVNIYAGHTGGDDRSRAKMNADPYFVSGLIDSFIPGYVTPDDAVAQFGCVSGNPWAYDPSNISCKCFLYNEGGKDCTVPPVCATYHHRIIKDSELILWEGHGHVSITMEIKPILEALVKGVKVEKPNYDK